jgi:DNA-binding winged helix-turn-helix (wHTH) protein
MDGTFAFDRFRLDPANRTLTCDGAPVELSARYLDALVLLVSEPGRLVTKDRFMGDVWRGIPVTDEALTQCIRTLRRQLGDDAANPRLIETVPKHGYRFVGEVLAVEPSGSPAFPVPGAHGARSSAALDLALAGTLGGGAAGLIGGLFYGFAATSRPPGEGAISVLLVLASVTVVVALLGAAAVSGGIATARTLSRGPSAWDVLGGALGGLVVGAVVKLVGIDAFALLLGHAPRGMTGAPEGLVLGAAAGLGAWLATGWSLRRGVAAAALAGAAAGALVWLLGGRLFGGSLALLAHDFPGSRLSLSGVSALFGEADFSSKSELVTGVLEGALFGAGIVGAMAWSRRR